MSGEQLTTTVCVSELEGTRDIDKFWSITFFFPQNYASTKSLQFLSTCFDSYSALLLLFCFYSALRSFCQFRQKRRPVFCPLPPRAFSDIRFERDVLYVYHSNYSFFCRTRTRTWRGRNGIKGITQINNMTKLLLPRAVFQLKNICVHH